MVPSQQGEMIHMQWSGLILTHSSAQTLSSEGNFSKTWS